MPGASPSALRSPVTRWRRPSAGAAAFLVAVALLLPAVAEGQETAWDSALADFAAEVGSDVAEDGVGGIAAGVVVGDSLVWARGFGRADPRREVPMTPGTLSRTGSISKSFTAVLLMTLVEDGALSLDAPVARHVPELANLADRPPGADSITFRQLASHTAGLVREPALEDAAAGPIETWEAKILASIHHTAFQALPGEEYSYSNIGVGILGLALARAADRPFTTLVFERIFEPLGMSRSTFVVDLELAPLLARGHANGEDGSVNEAWPAREHAGRGYKVPNGGVYSTVRDLGRFMAAMTGAAEPGILGADARREMLGKQTPEEGPDGYGLGFYVRETEEGIALAGHGGSVAGYTAHLVFAPGPQIGVVLLRNYNRGATDLGERTRALLRDLVEAR